MLAIGYLQQPILPLFSIYKYKIHQGWNQTKNFNFIRGNFFFHRNVCPRKFTLFCFHISKENEFQYCDSLRGLSSDAENAKQKYITFKK